MKQFTRLILIGVASLAVLGVLAVVFVGTGGAQTFSTGTNGLPAITDRQTVELKDGDTYQLTAEPAVGEIAGKKVRMLAYNDSVPGPTIKVRQGSTVTINFTNKTDVDSTLHAHGVRMANQFDGVPDVTQPKVAPGQSFTYKLTFPDAGAYWYHPHLREDYTQEFGLYGNFLVTPQDPAYWPQVSREELVTLDDVLLEDGKIAPFKKEQVDRTLMGRFGNTMLVNGQTDYTMEAKTGETVRYYLTNTANTRTFRLIAPGLDWKVVGGDGGKLEREYVTDALTLSPSERGIIEVRYGKPGKYVLQQAAEGKTQTLATISVGGSEQTVANFAPRTNPDIVAAIDPFRSAIAAAPTKTLTLGIDMMGSMNGMDHGSMSWLVPRAMAQMDHSSMNHAGMSTSANSIEWEDKDPKANADSTKENVTWKLTDQATGASNMDINWQFKRGDKVKLRISNDPRSMHPMQHPIHLHGQRFLVAATNGKPNDNLGWKDSALIQTGDTVDLVVDMSNPGDWLIHCHIPEHMEAGMMAKFTVT